MSTHRVYEAMRNFTDTRAAARGKYLDTMRTITDAKGSKYWTDKQSAAAKLRAETVAVDRKRCESVLQDAFAAMHERNHKRTMRAPTEEQLRLLQLLQMREHLTEDDLITAANALQGNGAALEVVQDIARKHEILRNFRDNADEFSIQQADEEIHKLAAGCERLLNSAARPVSVIAAEMASCHYGTEYNEDDLPQVPLFASESQFEQYMGYDDRLKNVT